MYTVTVLFASAVPEIGGLVLFVYEPFAGRLTTGAAGATVSTVKVFVLEKRADVAGRRRSPSP